MQSVFFSFLSTTHASAYVSELGSCWLTDGDHHERPKDHQAQPKEDQIKLQEVKEMAKLCRKVLFLLEELVPDSSLRKVIFVTTFGQAQVDLQFDGPYAFEA